MSDVQWKNPVVKWVDDRLPVFTLMHHSTSGYPTPKNLNYWWNFGSLALTALIIMIATGIFLVMNYTPHTSMAFDSVERIMRDVNYGWLLRYLHANGASMFFIVVYIHMFRNLYYGSYRAPRELLWFLGLFIYLAMMATGFLGYVLPWGQMSFWGATVITNLFSAIPFVGEYVVTWLWGGFSVDNPTLNRFFSLHYLLPFVLFALVALHLWALHVVKSNNPAGIEIKSEEDTIPFHPYYTIKDLFGIGVFMIILLAFVFWAPNFFGEPDNYIEANPMVTPPHIVPEWYYLPFYAILRAFTADAIIYIPFGWLFISPKLAGVIAMFGAIIILFFLPWLDTSPVKSAKYRPIFKQFFWIFVIDVIILGYCGAKSPTDELFGIKLEIVSQVATAYYFMHFIVLTPLLGWMEKPREVPNSIADAVTKPAKTEEA